MSEQQSGGTDSDTTRRNIIRSTAMLLGFGIGGGYYAVKSTTDTTDPASEPPSKNWRETNYTFGFDVNEWVRELGESSYSPAVWQCCARFLAPDSMAQVIVLRRPTNGGWVYRPERDSDVSLIYKRLPDDESEALTERYGDATTVSTSEVLDALDEQPTGEATDHNGGEQP